MKKQLGKIYVILSAILFGTMPLLTKIPYAHGSNAYTVAFGRFLSASILFGIIGMLSPDCSLKVKKEYLSELIILSISYGLVPIMLYMSYNYIDGGMATTLHFTYPVAVILILAIFYNATLDLKQGICTVLCIVGMGLLYTPSGQANLQGMGLAIVSGIIYAIYIVLLGKSTVRHIHAITLAFWLVTFATIQIGIIALCSGNLVFAMDATAWIAEFLIGLFASVFALVLFQKGLFLCGEVQASLLSTFEPLTGIVIGMIAFQEVLSAKETMGILAILLATILLVIPINERCKQK